MIHDGLKIKAGNPHDCNRKPGMIKISQAGSTQPKIRTLLYLALGMACLGAPEKLSSAATDETEVRKSSSGTLRLSDGSQLKGQLVSFGASVETDNDAESGGESSGRPERHAKQGTADVATGDTQSTLPLLTWTCPLFLEPLSFHLQGESEVAFDNVSNAEVEPFQVRLRNGDTISGNLTEVGKDGIRLRSRRHGTIRIAAREMVDVQRRREPFVGPDGLQHWNVVQGDETAWTAADDGALVSRKSEGAIFRALPMGDCEIEFELSSEEHPPQFCLGVNELGSGGPAITTNTASHVVLSYNSGEIPDVELAEMSADQRSLSLRLRWRQRDRVITVHDRSQKRLGEMKLPKTAAGSNIRTGIFLRNQGDDLRLDRIRVSRMAWSEVTEPTEVASEGNASSLRLILRDGRQFENDFMRTESEQVIVGQDEVETIGIDEIDAVVIGAQAERTRDVVPQANPTNKSPRTIQAVATWTDGDKITGDLLSIDIDSLMLQSSQIGQVTSRRIGLKSLKISAPSSSGSRGSDQITSTLTRGLSGNIVLGNDRAPMLWRQDQAVRPVLINDSLPVRITLANWGVADRQQFPETLYLKSGDVMACRVIAADDRSFHVKHPFGEPVVLPFHVVRAIELKREPNLPASETRKRVLTVPRFRMDDPFMHALIAKNGDVLRGHLVSVSDDSIRFESRGEQFRFNKDLVATIVCVDEPSSLPEDSNAQASPSQEDQTDGHATSAAASDDAQHVPGRFPNVQLRMAGNLAVSVTLQDSEEQSLTGRSSQLGVCRVAYDEIEEVRFGPVAPHHRYRLWAPLGAVEPRWEVQSAVPEDATLLVGTEAEDFELAELGAKEPFRLSTNRGRIVVLDFWASWCGPCVRALPEYVDVIAQEDRQQVIMLGINISDSPKKVREFLEDEDLDELRVLFDHRQQVAQQFSVTGIPHTVVIGKDGVIEHVQVGYSRNAASELKQLIERLKARR